MSAVGLTQAVLTFDWISMLTYFFTILMGLIFGILQMNQTETFWTTEYWKYAHKLKEERDAELAKKEMEESNRLAKEQTAVDAAEHIQQADDSAGHSRGTDLLEPNNSSRLDSNI